ncbi:MAG: hypothetical protein DRO90_02325, partial [Candidatus Altiarchaeales archaeon]
QIRKFVWHDLADNYIEIVKHRLYKSEIYGEESRRGAQYTLHEVINVLIRLLSPFTPHICDELWTNLFGNGYASISEWPRVNEEFIDKNAEEIGNLLIEIVVEIRRYKTENKLPLGSELKRVDLYINSNLRSKVERIREDLIGAGRIKELNIIPRDMEGVKLEITENLS